MLRQLVEVVGLRDLDRLLDLCISDAQRQLAEQVVDFPLVGGRLLGVAKSLQNQIAVLALRDHGGVALADSLAPASLADQLPARLDGDPDRGLRLLRLPAQPLGQLLHLSLGQHVLGVSRHAALVAERTHHPQIDRRALPGIVVRRVNLAHQVVVEVRYLQALRLDAGAEPILGLLVLRLGPALDRLASLPLIPDLQGGGGVRSQRGAG